MASEEVMEEDHEVVDKPPGRPVDAQEIGSVAGEEREDARGSRPGSVFGSMPPEAANEPGSTVGNLSKTQVPIAPSVDPSMPEFSPTHEKDYSSVAAYAENGRSGGFKSPVKGPSSIKGSTREKSSQATEVEDNGLRQMHKFSLYETQTRYYLVGGDVTDSLFRVLKIDRTAPPGKLQIVEDEIVYTKRKMNQLLDAINDGNKASGGMKLVTNSWGLLGFIRFTDAYYMLVVTKRQPVAMVGGHYIYQIDGTELVPLTTGSISRFQSNRNPEESHFLSILNNLDLHRSFYFSYSYNITRTLQRNIIRERERGSSDFPEVRLNDFNNMFVWNHHLLDPAVQNLKNPYDWCVPIIHGFVDQSCVDIFGRNIYITVIARRSRFFAGARFLKRGVNDLGYVANDVETESIVADMLVTPFSVHASSSQVKPNYTSFVQHRGSIPLYWTQDNTGVSPKPAIDLNFTDPFYAAAALHFDNLFERYGTPLVVLNLVKQRERTPRESKLLVEYQNAIRYLNQTLPEDKKIVYRAYDMSRGAKTGQDVIAALEDISEDLVRRTGFFHNGQTESGETVVQTGVIRSNCIDCLDRTNAAQFVVAKRALAEQLQALGVLAEDHLNYDSDASNLYAHMFNDHGDTLASQYGGSHLVNTTDSYRKINNWQSHSRDMLESFKRYYHNSFLDNQRQEAYNLFLGNYIYAQGQPMLWELPNDYYLHHSSPSARFKQGRRHYIQWYTLKHLENDRLPPLPPLQSDVPSIFAKDWWQEHYRPPIISSFLRIFAYKMNSTKRYLPKNSSRNIDMSPFIVRKPSNEPTSHSTDSKDHQPEAIGPLQATTAPRRGTNRISSIEQWLNSAPPQTSRLRNARLDEPPAASPSHLPQPNSTTDANFRPADKTVRNLWTLRQFHANSLHPSVADSEAAEYERYVTHPLRLPLVVSERAEHDTSKASTPATARSSSPAAARSSTPSQPPHESSSLSAAYVEFAEYLNRAKPHAGDAERDEDILEFEHFVRVRDDALGVNKEDWEKKRYQAYGKWLLKGKSLFKQSKVDPEYSQVA